MDKLNHFKIINVLFNLINLKTLKNLQFNKLKMSEIKEFEPPRTILIENFKYTFKDKLKDYSYRCIHQCNLLLKINEEDIENKNYKIKYTITSTLKEHICIRKESEENIPNNYIKSKENKPEIIDLQTNNIFLKPNQLKWILQKLREAKFPSDSKYLEDITKINITLEENSDLKEIPLCYKTVNFINPTKNYTNDKYIIFTSYFQIKLLKKVKQIFVDGTLWICPKRYYQVLNIGGYLENINRIVPIFLIITTGKSEYLYN